MPYRVNRNDSTAQAAVRRIAREQVKSALRDVADRSRDQAAAIHDVRKRCKKIRGLLRLVRPAFGAYRAENAAFREIATPLGPLRDAEVLITTLDHVIDATGTDEAQACASIRHQLGVRRQAIADEQDPDDLLRAAQEALQAALPRIDEWRLAEDGFDAFQDGLVSSYRRGRKAMRAACRTGDDEAFHDWRKRCKDHAFHLRLLRPIWPGPMRAQRACAEQLGELLGDHHDLTVLAARTRDMSDPDRNAIDGLLARVRTLQRELAQRADSLGARLYAEPPSALAKSWRRRYKAWKRTDEGNQRKGQG